ncbi:hypothetical protein DFR24_3834 [Panacagrimonas perspica]|uniref:Uncharacterized protein n=1 Tax=Panacagrimonas perspica TaxID=381431 RepID=A0A4R7NZM0_9GAMM|nr:hypothetical protein [Panacagrimonas perspica]TDU26803.1 hypothetical protein DFR24_3834 [Panacagrimonas perspica]THD03582.1 hypothetical protein B1810_08500 [Panacagrimonas perspica]
MTRSGKRRTPSSASVDRAFDSFLQASVDEDREDRLLSVLSALARLDLDPWKEAAELAALPTAAAIERLTGLIASLPDASATPRDAAGIAARLVTRLPSSQRAPIDSEEQPEPAGDSAEPSAPFDSDPDEGRGPSRWYSGPLLSIALVFVVILLAFSIFSGRAPYDLFTPPDDGAGHSSLNVTPRSGPPATPSRPARDE